jgi:ABC-type xylose transport system permease subunit
MSILPLRLKGSLFPFLVFVMQPSDLSTKTAQQRINGLLILAVSVPEQHSYFGQDVSIQLWKSILKLIHQPNSISVLALPVLLVLLMRFVDISVVMSEGLLRAQVAHGGVGMGSGRTSDVVVRLELVGRRLLMQELATTATRVDLSQHVLR